MCLPRRWSTTRRAIVTARSSRPTTTHAGVADLALVALARPCLLARARFVQGLGVAKSSPATRHAPRLVHYPPRSRRARAAPDRPRSSAPSPSSRSSSELGLAAPPEHSIAAKSSQAAQCETLHVWCSSSPRSRRARSHAIRSSTHACRHPRLLALARAWDLARARYILGPWYIRLI